MTTNLDTSYVFSGLRPFTGPLNAPGYGSYGLTGATAPSRYVGATTSGAPGSGTFLLGDFIVDQTGAFWVCTTAGSPGSWTKVAAGGGGSSPLTTKGDLYTHGGADARLPVGTDGFILNADSAQTLGIGWSTRDYNLNNKNAFNVAGEVIGGTAFPTTTSNGGGSINTGPAQFASTATYSISLNNSSNPFTAAWVMNDTITVNATAGSGESAGVALRPNMTFSNGQTLQIGTMLDGSLNLSGTDTLDQAYIIGAQVSAGVAGITNFRGANLSLTVKSGTTVTTAAFFRPFLNVNAGGTCTTAIGVDLTNLNGAGTAWAVKAGNYNSYWQGNTSFGSNSTPTYAVDVTGTVRASDSSTTASGFIATMSGTPAASTTLAAFSDASSSFALGSNASALYVSLYAGPTITGSPTATYIGALALPALSGAGTATKFMGAAIGSLAPSGTITTMVGLDIGVSYPLHGSTVWGLQVGAYQSYHQGNLVLGANAFPTATTSGSTLSANPVFSTNGTYTTTLVSSDFFIPALLNDTITTAGATTNSQLFAVGVYPTITASSSTTTLTAGGLACSPTFAGSDTYGTTYGLTLNATLKSTITNAYGINSFVVQNSANTVATLTLFKGQTLKLAGTITTLIGLDLTSLSGGSTIWGMQVGNFQSYHTGKFSFGGTGAPNNQIDMKAGSFNFTVPQAPAYASTINVDVTQGNVVEFTTTNAVGNATITLTAATVAGQPLMFIIHNDATANRTITFSTNLRSNGTLIGTASKTATICFLSNGSEYYETSRTTGLTT